MHPAQRRAIVAIIAMIEQGLSQLKGMLLSSEDEPNHPQQQAAQPFSNGALSDDEERLLEQEMEQHRLDMERASTRFAERAYSGGDPLQIFEDQ